MEKRRKKLRTRLIQILTSVDESYKSGHLYYRKPATKMNYPCILYNLLGGDYSYADNTKYIKNYRFSITVIDEDEDSPIAEAVENLPGCSLDRTFQTEGLNHFVYTITI